MWATLLFIVAVASATSPPQEDCNRRPPHSVKKPCGYNEVFVECKTICPPQSCNLPYTSYFCTEESKRCEAGCDCIKDHFRNSSDICVPSDQCDGPNSEVITENPNEPKPEPVCKDPNETYNDCPPCPPDHMCAAVVCEPCQCKENYVRNSEGRCVPQENNPTVKKPCGYNEVFVECKTICPPQSCNLPYTSYFCTEESKRCEAGCDCIKDHFRNSSDICVPSDQCDGPNSEVITENPNEPKPEPVCKDPNETYNDCPPCPPDHMCAAVVCEPCQCKENYVRNSEGRCVPQENNPTANVCPKNQTEVDCTFKCPYHYCPDDDGTVQYACKPPRDCPSGCGCQIGYRYKSNDDPTCILAEECPPQPCTTNPNEVWHPCPSCLAESCADADTPQTSVCNELVHNCQPRCICKKGYYRNESNICVHKSECQKCKENERYVPCKSGCPTDYCAENENQYKVACDPIPPEYCTGGCICEVNNKYRSYENKTCIPATDCPPVKCNNPNEVWNSCASPCLYESCENDQQSASDHCATYCDPKCVCKEGHCRNKDGTCVPKCSKRNEVWNSCASPCLQESCDNSQRPASGEVCADYCDAKCVCEEGHCRNTDGNCVPEC